MYTCCSTRRHLFMSHLFNLFERPRKYCRVVKSIRHANISSQNELVSFTSCSLTSQFHNLSCVHLASLILGTLSVLYLFYSFKIQPPRQNYINTDTKYILTWCDDWDNYKYGWEFGEKKFRSMSFV